MKSLKWGVLGTGNIANQFTEGVAGSQRSAVVAVGSRRQSSASDFAAVHHISTAHESYESLLADQEVEAIYLALPNAMHHEWTLKAIAAGKHVLCEKPLAMNACEAEEMFDLAEKAGVLLVEAFMYRTHPLIAEITKKIDDGAIGSLRMIRSSFCYHTKKVEGNVRFDRSLGGGGLMDVGCYCLSLSRYFARSEPVDLSVTAHMHASGVDDLCAGTLRFANGILASFTCGMAAQTDNTAYLCGTDGFLEIPIPWKPPQHEAKYIINAMTPPRQDQTSQPRKPREVFSVSAPCPLYGLEADRFAASVQDGCDPCVTRADTMGNMKTLDAMRDLIGLSW